MDCFASTAAKEAATLLKSLSRNILQETAYAAPTNQESSIYRKKRRVDAEDILNSAVRLQLERSDWWNIHINTDTPMQTTHLVQVMH